jgi:hypothetical protein
VGGGGKCLFGLTATATAVKHDVDTLFFAQLVALHQSWLANLVVCDILIQVANSWPKWGHVFATHLARSWPKWGPSIANHFERARRQAAKTRSHRPRLNPASSQSPSPITAVGLSLRQQWQRLLLHVLLVVLQVGPNPGATGHGLLFRLLGKELFFNQGIRDGLAVQLDPNLSPVLVVPGVREVLLLAHVKAIKELGYHNRKNRLAVGLDQILEVKLAERLHWGQSQGTSGSEDLAKLLPNEFLLEALLRLLGSLV